MKQFIVALLLLSTQAYRLNQKDADFEESVTEEELAVKANQKWNDKLAVNTNQENTN